MKVCPMAGIARWLWAAALGFGTAQGQESLEAGEWFAACDNRGLCRAFGFAPAEDESLPWIGGEEESVLELAREESGQYTVRIHAPAGAPPDRIWRLSIDEEPILEIEGIEKWCAPDETLHLCEGVVLSNPRKVQELLEAMARGGRVLTLSADGAPIAYIALNGFQELRAWLQARGLPPSAATDRGAWKRLSEEELTPWLDAARAQREAQECDTPEADPGYPPGEAFRHPDGTLFVLLDCLAGAYNQVALGFVLPPGGEALRPFDPEWPERFPESEREDLPKLVNANFDPERGELTIFSKFRAVGDCGRVASWRYRDGSFHLTEYRIMTFCRGLLPDRWPYLWRD